MCLSDYVFTDALIKWKARACVGSWWVELQNFSIISSIDPVIAVRGVVFPPVQTVLGFLIIFCCCIRQAQGPCSRLTLWYCCHTVATRSLGNQVVSRLTLKTAATVTYAPVCAFRLSTSSWTGTVRVEIEMIMWCRLMFPSVTVRRAIRIVSFVGYCIVQVKPRFACSLFTSFLRPHPVACGPSLNHFANWNFMYSLNQSDIFETLGRSLLTDSIT